MSGEDIEDSNEESTITTTKTVIIDRTTTTSLLGGVEGGEEVVETCEELPVFEKNETSRIQFRSLVGEQTFLDVHQLFNVSSIDSNYLWKQIFSERDSLEYVTNYSANLLNSTFATAYFIPEVPGNYRFRVTVTDDDGSVNDYELDVWVTKVSERNFDVKGAIFVDVFGMNGGPEFNFAPKDPDCLAIVQDHALDAPLRIGADWTGFVSSAFYSQVSPMPIFIDWENDLSLSNETYFASLVDSAKQRGLKVMQTDSVTAGLGLSQEQMDSEKDMRMDPAWWDEWFNQWKKYVVPRAARAEKYDVDMYVVDLFADSTFNPDVYPEYGERWREIISEVREVYSGIVAISLINADERFTFEDAVDAVLITLFPGLYTSSGNIVDTTKPTLIELEEQTKISFSQAEWKLAGKVSVYYIFLASSSDGQISGEPPPWGWGPIPPEKVDFQEQAMYYEAFFNMLEQQEWVSGVFTERWDWFDQFHRPGDFLEAYYFDETIGGSPRSKPAEDVVRLWFEIYE